MTVPTVSTDRVAFIAAQPTPVGVLTIVADGDTVLAAGFTDDADHLLGLISPLLRPTTLDRRSSLGAISDAVDAYFSGSLDAIDSIAVAQRSTAIRERGWEALRQIAPGEPISYGELAKRIDRPRGARAAGQICARNAASLFVPCHRVVAADGAPHHYGWGLPVKEWLLDHETATKPTR